MKTVQRWPGLLASLLLTACATGGAPTPSFESEPVLQQRPSPVSAPSPQAGPTYDLHYQATLAPAEDRAHVVVTVNQTSPALRSLDFNAPEKFFSDFHGDGEVRATGNRVLWRVPERGGSLRYSVVVNRLRGKQYDARLTAQYGVFRLDDLFPAAKARAQLGTRATATLSFDGPTGWRYETAYGPSSMEVHTIISDRLFPRPVGWAVTGIIGVRRDLIADRRVAIAAPVGESFRRQDTLAFLRWTLPALVAVFPGFPDRLLIAGGSSEMWRGGLSGPDSLFLHPDRPLISGNATSTLLHELVHVAIASTDGTSDDWLVEGLAEYYSLELLRRSGGISQERFANTLVWLADWVDKEGGRLTNPSTGPNTASAVLALHDLAIGLDARNRTLDDLVRTLIAGGQITGDALRALLRQVEVSSPAIDQAP